ncbi:MAG: polysaccharide deacetylase family protein [Negativicutes bacterium]
MLTRRRFLTNSILSAASIGMSAFLSPYPATFAEKIDIPVLLYHRIGDTDSHLSIASDKFAADLTWLREKGYETISLEKFRQFRLDSETLLPESPVLITFDDGYLDNYLNAYAVLRQYGMTAAFFVITGMIGEEDRLTAGHIREMATNGMSIGSHTVSHRSLGDMDVEEAANEMSLSRLYLEGLLQQPVRFIAYPKGSFNESTAQIANEAAYWGGFSVMTGTCSRDTNPYVLRRIPVFSFDGNVGRAMAKRRYG